VPDSVTKTEEAVAHAAHDLVDAFSRFDRDAYFASFHENADFIFYNSDVSFSNRAEYEAAWNTWVGAGWRVLHCESVGARTRVLDDRNAVFTHEVFTTLDTSEGEVSTHERETIIFARYDTRWLAVHEHLSAVPSS
jgi:ketosteroid isomerase-like protein